MPHIVLEYSDQQPALPDFQALFADLHAALVSVGDIALADIKSRALCLDNWRIGDGDPRHSFVHLKLYLIDSRTPDFKRRALAAIKPVVAAHFARSLAESLCQLCFEVIDIRGEFYDKIVSP